jgi:Ca2+-binding EF-hand superfamily protein
MVKARVLAVSAVLGLAVLAAPALADKGHGLFDRADKNGDGFVSRVEFNASRAVMFARLDSSGDGSITQEEVDVARKAFRERHGNTAGKPPVDQNHAHNKPHKGHRFFERIDANGDGRVGGAEFAAAGDRVFAKLDSNGDGQLTKEEMPRRHKHKPAGATDPNAAPSQ